MTTFLKFVSKFVLIVVSSQILQAQLLPPQALNYERTGRSSVELTWLAPNSGQSYPSYNLTDWIPKSYFYTKTGSPRSQDCAISDGTFIYTSSVNFEEGELMKFDLNGNYIETFIIPGVPHIYKMAYDGVFFYAVQYEKPGIYQLNMDEKKLVSIIPTPINIYHICYIPTLDNGNGGFEVGNPAQGYYLRKDGTYLSYGPSYSNYVGCSATAWYDGKLYAFCQIAGSYKGIVEFNVETAQPTGNILDLGNLIGQAGIATDQLADDLNFYEYPDGTMNALMTLYYSNTSETGTIISIFETGKRPLPPGLQGYNVYKENVKQNSNLLNASVYTYPSSGLNEETDYDYHLTAVYDGEESPAGQALTVRLPATNHLPLREDFSSGNYQNPNFWEISPTPTSTVWKVIQTQASLGEYLPSLSYTYAYYTDYNQTFVSKPLRSVGSIIKLRYDIACISRGLTNEKLHVEVLVNDIWHTISTESSADISSWQTKEYDITSLVQAKDFQLRFRVSGISGTTSYYWYLDNIRIWEPEYLLFGGIIETIDLPVAEATIQLTKSDDPGLVYETVSDEEGNFLFTSIEKGTYRMNVFQNGKELYANPDYPIEVENTNVSLVLPAARLQIDATPIQVLMGKGKTKTVRLPLSNTGNARLEWDTEIRYETLGNGNEIGESNIQGPPYWESEHIFDLDIPRETSLVFHKNYFYTVGEIFYASPAFVLKEYTTEGEMIHADTITTPECIIAGLVSDGEILYLITYPEDRGDFSPSLPGKLIPIDRENHRADESNAIVTDIEEISAMSCAAYDPVNDGFYIGSNHALHRIDRTGKVQKTYDGIIYSFTNKIVLDTFSEGGPYMWLFCRKTLPGYGGTNDQASILQFSLKEETMTNVFHSVMDVPDYDTSLYAAPAGFFGTTALVPGYFVLGGAISFANNVMNEKVSVFTYKMFPYENWLSLQTSTGEVTPGSFGELSFDLNTQSLEDGEERQASLILKANSQDPAVEIPVKLIVNDASEANCYAPENPQAALTSTFDVQLTWSLPEGTPQIKGYQVFGNGRLLQEKLITGESFVDTIPGMGMQTYTVKAFYESGCESYESDPVEIFVNDPEIVLPVKLTTSVVNKKHVLLKWDAPRYGTGLFDDFEAYPAFTIHDIGDWKLVDGDKSWTYYDNSISYLNAGEPMAFMVFNPSASSPASPTIMPCDDKKQFLACFSANVDKLANNDWLISPELDFNRPFSFSFMGKTHSLQYGFEKINIAYSLTGNNPEDFIFVNGDTPVDITDIWWKYEYSIPAEAKYVAINCVTLNGFILFIDNIYIGYPEYYSGLQGYNVYKNGQKLNPVLLPANLYVDSDLENGSYTYEIEALFANGTSSKAVAVVDINYSYEAGPPRDLEAVRQDNTIQLSWLPPLNYQTEDLQYDSGITVNSVGADDGQLVGVRWNASDLEAYLGYSITGVKFHISEPVLYVIPFLYKNGNLVRGGMEMTAEVGEYTIFRFDTPLIIKPAEEYIAGYYYLPAAIGYYPISHDAGPSVAGKSDLISSDGSTWYSAYQLWGEEFNVNWNIAMLVEWNEEGDFQGYNLYRNNTKVNNNLLIEPVYTDEDDKTRKDYFVSAVYKTNGEKNSNHVIVEELGINSLNNSLVTVYPNPAKDKLFVKGDYDTLELLSLDGKKIRKIPFKGETVNEIDIQNILPGVYLLGVKKDSIMEYYKVIVKGNE
ncbi:MAG: choice-of-anchor J domain-containing protein [Dysgonamonadaceae bacterium]|jgi:hypothetical protein|nr:choice-of-anchor J domain-containing protein [Dysgonamonadaceae bacterium]